MSTTTRPKLNPCTPATANAICNLLNSDPHARALFKLLMAGIRPGRGQGNKRINLPPDYSSPRPGFVAW